MGTSLFPARTARRVLGAALTGVVLLGLGVVAGGAPAGADAPVAAPPSGPWTVDGHGFGHGHGLSQYGAQGAALRGLSAAQIIAFYYPHTTLVSKADTTVRVLIGGSSRTVVAAAGGLALTGVGPLTVACATRYQLVPSGGGLALQAWCGSTWTTVRNGLPAQADFSRSGGLVHLFLDDGSAVDYRGTVGAVRSGGGTLTVNRVGLDDYTQGVVPREMPASWAAAALQAQATAARSYARYAVEHNAAGSYDICDSTDCQVYGGAQRYAPDGSPTYGEDPRSTAAVAATRGQVAVYAGATIFAQFSASDGGWTADGGQPYLTAHADPYEQYSASPYYAWTRTVSPATVAQAYGLATVTGVQVTSRDGGGQWGGRVLSATVTGTRPGGAAASVATSGPALADAMGLPNYWFEIRAPQVCPGPGVGLVNSSFDSGLSGWSTSNVSLAGYGSTRPGDGGRLINGYATADRGSLLQDVHPAAGVVPGRTYGATIWLTQRVGLPPTDLALALFALGGQGGGQAVSYLHVPADGAWHAYSVTLRATAAASTLRVQLYFWYAHQNVTMDGTRLSDDCLTNSGFAAAPPLAGWVTDDVSLAGYPYPSAADGRLINGQSTVAQGFLAQSVAPSGGVQPGSSYTGTLRALVPIGHQPAAIGLYVIDTTGTGAIVPANLAVDYVTVPDDGAWHSYAVTLGVTRPGTLVQLRVALWYPNHNISIDSATLT